MTYYAPINESVRIGVATEFPAETRSALAAFFRRNRYPHVYLEILEPLLSRAKLVLALATTDRPWPPKGIGSQSIEALGIAMIGSENRAFLTPVLTDLKHSTNLGLAAAVTKHLLENLRERKASSAGYLVRQGDRAVERAVEQAGFAKSDLLAATEFAEYTEYSATPDKILKTLELNKGKLSDVLSLALDGKQLDRLAIYHYTLTVAIFPYLFDISQYAALLPGLLDVIASLPPGGVPPGSPGPGLVGGGAEE